MAINNLNERVLQKEDIKEQVVAMLKDTKTDIDTTYIETIKGLTPTEMAALIHTNYYDTTNNRRKPRQEMKPTEENGHAYTVLVQAALHQLYPKVQVDGLYEEETTRYVTFLQQHRNSDHQDHQVKNDGVAGPDVFSILHTYLQDPTKRSATARNSDYEQIDASKEVLSSTEEMEFDTEYPTEFGLSSMYSDLFDQKPTASGELYDKTKFTCAHKTFPFGTTVRVFNNYTQQFVDVKVNDRGPFISGRVVELSREAAEQIGLKEGTTAVRIQVLKTKV